MNLVFITVVNTGKTPGRCVEKGCEGVVVRGRDKEGSGASGRFVNRYVYSGTSGIGDRKRVKPESPFGLHDKF